MSTLPTPVREVLDDGIDERAVQRMWRGVERRRAATRAVITPRRVVTLAVAAAAAIVLAVVVRGARHPHAEAVVPGALRRLDGGELATLQASGATDTSIALDDGSTLVLVPGTRIDTLENTGSTITLLLVGGRTHFEVHPGGPRRWSIECGVATVEVVGTGFTVERDRDHVRVSVSHGVVLVRGERVPERVQRLVAGQSIDLNVSVAAPVPQGSAPAAAVIAPPSDRGARTLRRISSVPAAEPDAATTALPADWHALAHAQAYAAAYDVLGPAGIATATQHASVDELLALADVARLSGHPLDAREPLDRIVDEHPSDPSAGVAAFTLGRLELDQLHDPARAAAAFGRAVALGVPQGLEEDALARLVEARARAGDQPGARQAAERYRALFPQGRRAAQVARWASGG